MPGETTASGDDNALPTLSAMSKEHDYASQLDHNQSTTGHHGLSEHDGDGYESAGDTTATYSSDEFNWDEDEEAVASVIQNTKAKRGRALYLAFMKLARPFRVILIGLLGAGVLITPLLVMQLKFKQSPVRPQVHMWSLWLSIIWASSCITYLLVDSIPRFVVAVIVLFGGQVERLKTQLELVLAVSGWIKLALDVSWAWISLAVLRAFYNPGGDYWTTINHLMQALFSTGLIMLVEKTFLQFVAISFHRKALADRLAENQLGLKALDRLSNAQPAPVKKPPHSTKGHRHHTTASFGIPGRKVTNNEEQINGRASTPGSPVLDEKPGHRHRAGHVERQRKRRKAMASIIVDQVGSVIGQVTLKNSKFNRQGEIGGLSSARRLARKLFASLSDVTPHRSHLVVDDFVPYFRSVSEAHDAFALFDKDGNGDISKKEMRDAVQRIYRERKSLIAGLKDVSSAVAKLDAVLLAVALIFIVFIFLLIFNRQNTLASLVPLATVVLGFSFIFGHTAQLLFESLIFIFSTHVFDVGDLVMIDDQPLLVREFGLFSTTFRRVDGQEIIAPNSLLNSTKLVHNLRRSNSMWETTNLTISYNTPLEVIEQLKSRLQQYISENNRDWIAFNLNIDKMEFQNAIWLVIAVQHRPNWQDWGGRWGRRTAFMRHLKIVLEDLDVKYTMPIQPILLPNKPVFNSSPRLQGSDVERREMLGNAGSFQGSTQLNRAPSRSLRPGDSTF